MRILHFSDPHLTISLGAVPLTKWFGKRAIGGANLFLRRRRLFADASEKLSALARFKNEQQVDLVICTGDYTALGLKQEYEEARRAVQPLMDAPMGYITVPGNHDYYVADVLREKLFSSYFGDTLLTDLSEYQADAPWPFVRLIGDEVAVIGVNSARPNPLPWRSSGRIPEQQLSVLAELLTDKRITSRVVFIVTHYAPLLADGSPDSKLHGLCNGRDFLSVCAAVPQAAILCGHIHRGYQVRIAETGQVIFCAGSATMEGKEGCWLFDVNKGSMRAGRLQWNGSSFVPTVEGDSSEV